MDHKICADFIGPKRSQLSRYNRPNDGVPEQPDKARAHPSVVFSVQSPPAIHASATAFVRRLICPLC
jgi:hypothetical protein